LSDFDDIYKENYPKMFRIAKKMLNDGEVSCDVVQEVFTYYYEKLQNGLIVQYPQSWLVRAVINKCVDYLKKRKKLTPLSAANNLVDKSENFDIQDEILKNALLRLKSLEMKIITLYSEGYSYKEIAQIAEINFSSVGSTLSRTLQKMKALLKKLNYEI
jgi:RNA polymerase sigma-70 factor (ECF subfamily)